jgi:uncharacterized protein (DUF1501 family)
MNMLSRRELLRRIGIGSLAASSTGLCFARAEVDERLVLVVLRGALDGLAMVAPYGDGKYSSVRGELALEGPGSDNSVLKLDGMFGLHPALPTVKEFFLREEATVVHAVASPYRERSHFDGQDILENGVVSAGERRDGWLNRALTPLGSELGNEIAIALSQTTPLVLRGHSSTTSWAPSRLPEADDDTLRRLSSLYSNDEFFRTRLNQAMEAQEIAGDMAEMRKPRRSGNDATQFIATMQQAAKFLTTSDGPRIAVVESGGWDTHANQGSANGSLANKLTALDEGLGALRKELGDTWDKTVVAVVTEFGRTVKVNGTRGTDHGTGTAALLLGGAIQGGRIYADWPGLANRDLFEGRDLYPTTDIRSVFKGVLVQHLDVAEAYIEREVFPDSQSAPLMEGLIRA